MFHDPRFWLAMSFTVFTILMIKYVAPILLKSIDSKRNKIADEISQAKLLKEQAEKLLADAKKYHDESLVYSQKIIDEAKELSASLLADSQKAIETEIAKKMDLAKERIKLEETVAIREIKSSIVSAAIKIVEDRATKLSNNSAASINKKAIDDIKVVH